MNKKPSRLGRKIFLSLLSLVVFALLAEGALRVRQKLKYGTFRNTVFNPSHDDATGLRAPTPNSRTGGIRINSLGFRSPELETPKPEGRVRVAFLGGSTTFCAEVTNNEATWPHLVWKTLGERRPDRTFDYLNAAVAGYGIAESLVTLRQRVAQHRPDVIVIYHATNDFTWDTRVLARAAGLDAGDEKPNWLAKWSLAWFLVDKNLTIRRRQQQAASGENRLEFDAKALATKFGVRLRELVAAAHEVAPIVALVTFSHRVRREQSTDARLDACQTALYYAPYLSVDGILRAVEEYNDAIRDVARATGAVLVDGENTIPADTTHFADSVHFTDAGCRKMATRVLSALTASPAFEKLLAPRQLPR